MEVTQTDKAITLDCGCNVDIIITAYSASNLAVQSTLSLCPLHAAADDLLAALKAKLCQCVFQTMVGTTTRKGSDYCYLHNELFRLHVDGIPNQTRQQRWLKQARDAIEKAEEPITS